MDWHGGNWGRVDWEDSRMVYDAQGNMRWTGGVSQQEGNWKDHGKSEWQNQHWWHDQGKGKDKGHGKSEWQNQNWWQNQYDDQGQGQYLDENHHQHYDKGKGKGKDKGKGKCKGKDKVENHGKDKVENHGKDKVENHGNGNDRELPVIIQALVGLFTLFQYDMITTFKTMLERHSSLITVDANKGKARPPNGYGLKHRLALKRTVTLMSLSANPDFRASYLDQLRAIPDDVVAGIIDNAQVIMYHFGNGDIMEDVDLGGEGIGFRLLLLLSDQINFISKVNIRTMLQNLTRPGVIDDIVVSQEQWTSIQNVFKSSCTETDGRNQIRTCLDQPENNCEKMVMNTMLIMVLAVLEMDHPSRVLTDWCNKLSKPLESERRGQADSWSLALDEVPNVEPITLYIHRVLNGWSGSGAWLGVGTGLVPYRSVGNNNQNKTIEALQRELHEARLLAFQSAEAACILTQHVSSLNQKLHANRLGSSSSSSSSSSMPTG